MATARRWLGRAASLGVVLAIFFGILPELVDFGEVWEIISADIGLWEGGLLALLTGASLAASWGALVAALPGLGFGDAARINVVTTSVSYSLPGGGAAGTAMTVGMLRRLGFGGAEVTRTILTTGIWYLAVRFALPVVALALVTLDADIPAGLQLAAFIGLLLVGLVAFLGAWGIWRGTPEGWLSKLVARVVNRVLRVMRRRRIPDIPSRIARFRADTADLIEHRWPGLTAAAVGYNLALFSVLAAALHMVGANVGIAQSLAVFAVARQLTALPITPGSAGVIELALIAGLDLAGAEVAAATAGVLVFRAFTFLLYLPLGIPAWVWWKSRHPAVSPRERPSPEAPVAPRPPLGITRDPLIRHPWDLVAGGLATLVVLVMVWMTRGPVSTVEENVFRLINRLPDAILPPVWLVMQMGMIAVVPVVVVVALVLRRRRIAFDLALAGVSAWLLAKAVKAIAGRPRPGALFEDVILRADAHPFEIGFLGGHAAVAAALATVAAAHVRRSVRWAMWAVVVGAGTARVYVGAHLPYDIVAGIALGWGLGSLIRITRGTPAHHPSGDRISAALRGLGIQVRALTPVAGDLRQALPFAVTSGTGPPLFVKVIGRDQRDADFVLRTWRSLTMRGATAETPFATPERMLEHEALALMLARRAGVSVPEVRATTRVDRGTWLLAMDQVDGVPLSELPPGRLEDDLLDRVWDQIAALGSARISHRDLRPENVLVKPDDSVWIVGFGAAAIDADETLLMQDLGQGLMTIAAAAGPDRAVAAMVRRFGPDSPASVLPHIRGRSLPWTRSGSLRSRLSTLATVRREVESVEGEGIAWQSGESSRGDVGIPLSDFPRRHPSDLGRVVIGITLGLAVSLFAARGFLLRAEVDLFRLVNELPEGLLVPLEVVMQLGAFAAVPVVAAIALALRRRRLALDLAVAGTVAWFAAKFVKAIADRGRPDELLAEIVVRGAPAHGLGFVSGHTAVAAALATVASGHSRRGVRHVFWALAVTVGVARVYVGAHFPLDVVAGAGLGWAIGAGVRFGRGTPLFTPTTGAVAEGLRRLGLPVVAVEPLHADARGSIPAVALLDDGSELLVKAVSEHERDADLLYRLWRFLSLGDPEPPLLSPKRQIEHEAYLLLLAERAGVRVPRLRGVGAVGDGVWMLAEDRIHGHVLEAYRGEIDDGLAERIWGQVGILHDARIAHRDLRAANVIVDQQGDPWLVDFSYSEATASQHLMAHDVAELLAAASVFAGVRTAVETAATVMGRNVLSSAEELLEPIALSRATRTSLRSRPGTLEALRLVVARMTGSRRSVARDTRRLRLIRWAALLLGAGALYLLLATVAGLGDVLDAARSLGWRWVFVAAIASGVALGGRAVARSGIALRRGHMGEALRMQLPMVGVRRRPPSVRAAVSIVVAVAVHGVALTLAVAATFVENTRAHRLADEWVALGGIGLALASAGALRSLGGGRWSVTAALDALREARARHGSLPVLAIGHSVATSATVLGFLAVLRAVGADVPAGAASVTLLTAGLLGMVGRIPGGVGVLEPIALVFLVGFGAEAAPAVLGVVVYQGLFFWIPAFLRSGTRPRAAPEPSVPSGEASVELVDSLQ